MTVMQMLSVLQFHSSRLARRASDTVVADNVEIISSLFLQHGYTDMGATLGLFYGLVN